MKFFKIECLKCGIAVVREIANPKSFVRTCPVCEEKMKPSELEIVNLTPHEITWFNTGEDDVTMTHIFPKCESPARFDEITVELEEYYPLPVMKKRILGVQNLPEQKERTFYVVSRICAEAVPQRTDVLIVNDTVRTAEGKIVGCENFAHI